MDPLNQLEIAQLRVIAAEESPVQRRRAELVLLADQGREPAEIAEQVGLSERRVYHWLREFRFKRMGIFRRVPSAEDAQAELESAQALDTQVAAPAAMSPAELAAQHGLDTEHCQRVAEAAAALFDAAVDTHRLPAEYRTLLEAAALLCPLQPKDVLAQPLADHTEQEQAILAALATLSQKKGRPGKGRLWANLPPDTRQDALALGAILRAAVPLGDSEVEVIVAGRQRLEVYVRGKLKKARGVRRASKLWTDLFHQEVVLLPGLHPHDLAARLAGAPELKADTPFDQAARAILTFHLEQIQAIGESPEEPDACAVFQRAVQAARHVFRAMGEQFDVTDVASLPRQLRWLNRNSRPPRQWEALAAQAEDYLASAGGKTAGVESMLQQWSVQRTKACDELELMFSGKRYHDFAEAAQRLIKTKNAGIFGRTAAGHRVRYILPGTVLDQYQQVCLLQGRLKTAKAKAVRDLRRQARSLYHLLADFRAVLGPSAADCLQALLTMDDYLTYLSDVRLAIDVSTEYLEESKKKSRPLDGIKEFVAAKEAEHEEMLERLPQKWELVGSQRFRRDLAMAVADL